MRSLLTIATACLMVALVSPAWAAARTVTLTVSNMSCAACPVTVKRALMKVPGVSSVTVTLARKEAVVTFDDGKTTVAALIRATTDAGYPSAIRETEKRLDGARR